MSALLECRGLTVTFGAAHAVSDLSLHVNAGEIVALVGANGSGKTTLLRTVAGLQRANAGSVTFCGAEVLGLPAHVIAARGLSLIPEGRGILGSLSVRDNLRLGAYLHGKPDETVLARIRQWFPILFDRLSQPAAMLSGGEQQMLAIARSLMSKPKLLMVDELSLGLSPKITSELVPRLQQVRSLGTSVLLVDQSIRLASRIADRMYVVANGELSWTGAPQDFGEEPESTEKYFGIDSSNPAKEEIRCKTSLK